MEAVLTTIKAARTEIWKLIDQARQKLPARGEGAVTITPAGDGRVVIEHTFDDGTVLRLAAILVPLKPHEQGRELRQGGKGL